MTSPILTRDVSVYYEQNGISMDATFEVRYDVDPETRHVTVIERYPVYVSYCDTLDHEYEWRYGENMPGRVVRALEIAEGYVDEEIRRKLMDRPYVA